MAASLAIIVLQKYTFCYFCSASVKNKKLENKKRRGYFKRICLVAQYGGRLGNSCSPRVSFFVSIVLKKKTKKVGAILKGCVWWHNRAAGWAKKFSKNIFFVNFCSVYVPKKN